MKYSLTLSATASPPLTAGEAVGRNLHLLPKNSRPSERAKTLNCFDVNPAYLFYAAQMDSECATHRGRDFIGSGIKVTATTIHKLAVFPCLNDWNFGDRQYGKSVSCSEKEF
jgi:hypothetical protein